VSLIRHLFASFDVSRNEFREVYFENKPCFFEGAEVD